MAQVEEMLIDERRQEGIQEGRQEIAKKIARNMLKRGDSIEAIAEVLELPVEAIHEMTNRI